MSPRKPDGTAVVVTAMAVPRQPGLVAVKVREVRGHFASGEARLVWPSGPERTLELVSIPQVNWNDPDAILRGMLILVVRGVTPSELEPGLIFSQSQGAPPLDL